MLLACISTGSLACVSGTGITTSGNRTYCQICPPGTYSPGGFRAPCRVCTASGTTLRRAMNPKPLWYKLPAGAKASRYSGFHPRRKATVRICGRCEAGFGLYGQPPVCTACPKDTYCPGKVQGPCFRCPEGSVTLGTGAKTRSECLVTGTGNMLCAAAASCLMLCMLLIQLEPLCLAKECTSAN